VKRGCMIAVAGAAIVVAGVAGCNKSSTTSTSSSPASSTSSSSASSSSTSSSGASSSGASSASSSAAAGAGQAKVTIDGQDQNANGAVHCNTSGNTTTIVIGEGSSGYTVAMDNGNPPTVTTVVLANIGGGVALAYHKGLGSGSAEATQDGNSYKVTGTATGMDMSNGMKMVSKPFEIDATCP
jgi:lipoprotein LpqH